MGRLPEVARVAFQPAANMPPGGSVSAQAHKSGAILEVPATMTIDAKLKTHSAFGSLVIDDVHEQTEQRVGQTVISYKLQIDGICTRTLVAETSALTGSTLTCTSRSSAGLSQMCRC